jgi:hypothetical protein
MRSALAVLLIAVGAALLLAGGISIGVGFPKVLQSQDPIASDIGWRFIWFGASVFAVGVAPLLFGIRIYPPLTARDLAGQKASDYRTWHFRPVGLMIFLLGLALFVVAANWAEQYVRGINAGRRSISGYLGGLLFFALMGFRKVRDFVFHTARVLDQVETAEDEAKEGLAGGRKKDEIANAGPSVGVDPADSSH